MDYVNPPTNVDTHYHESVQYLNLSWDYGFDDGEDAYVIIERNDDYATSVNQTGNIVRDNLSILDVDQWTTGSVNKVFVNLTQSDIGYISIFSWNESADIYSYNDSLSTKVDVNWGGITINVFNESNPSDAIVDWDIEITNSSGTVTYYKQNITNPLYLSQDEIPYGENTIFYVSADNYRERIFYLDLEYNNYYDERWYLPPIEGENASKLYSFRVIDENTYPVANAEVVVKRYINDTTAIYRNMTNIETDGYGEGQCWLIPGEHYRVFVTKQFYDDGIFEWIPEDYEIYYEPEPEIFQIYHTTSSGVNKTFWDVIQFNVTMYDNNTLFIQYNDLDSNTTNAHFNTMQNYNFSSIEHATNTTAGNSYSFWLYNINISREYEVILYLNSSNADIGFQVVSIIIEPIREPPHDQSDMERVFEDILGPFKLGYVVTFLLYIPCIALLVLPGPQHPGFAIIITSLYAGLITSLVVIGTVVLFIPFMIIIGAILMAVKGGIIKL